jgi:hypothetical protein
MAVPVSSSGIVQMVFTAQEDDQLTSSSPEAMVISGIYLASGEAVSVLAQHKSHHRNVYIRLSTSHPQASHAGKI